MEKIHIDSDLKGAALYKFLKDNKKQLINQKKEFIKKCDPFMSAPSYYVPVQEGGVKAISNAQIPADATIFNIKAVANTSMYCDSQMDVLLRDSAKKSMRERKGMIPFIKDHLYESTAKVAKVRNIFYQDIPLRQLGLKQEGTAQALVFDADVIRAWDEKVFEFYRTGEINQHSIGLQYMDIWLAINEPEDDYYEDEYKIWKKYIDQVINKEVPEERGYMWIIPQYRLLENSCVLLGANFLTPTLTAEEIKFFNQTDDVLITDDQPPVSTEDQPIIKDADTFDLDLAIKNFTLKF